jgi:hypothetical protein
MDGKHILILVGGASILLLVCVFGVAMGSMMMYVILEQARKPATPIIQEGLVAYYPFDGSTNDESGNGHQGAVFGLN